MKYFLEILILINFKFGATDCSKFNLQNAFNEIYEAATGATSKFNETLECQTAFISNSFEPSKALIYLKNYHVYRYKDSCYFVSKFELKFQQSANECRKSNNSDLFYINNDQEIDHFWHIENKISIFLNQRLLNKENDGTPDEKHYHIGLRFDSQNNHWFWSNGLEFNQKFNQKIRNDISKIGQGFSAYFLFVTGKTTTLAVSQRSSSRKNFICRFIIDHCFNNKKCGPNGSCQNDYFKKGYKCSCDLFSDGDHCEFWSIQSVQILICFLVSVAVFIVKLVVKISKKIQNKRKISVCNQKFNLDKYQKRSKQINFFLLIASFTSILLLYAFFSIYFKFEQNGQNADKICSWVILYDQKTIFVPIFLTLLLYLIKNGSVFETPLDPFSKQDRFITSLIFLDYFYRISKLFNLSNIFPSSIITSRTEDVLNFEFSNYIFFREILYKIFDVIQIGIDFFPILLCLELKSKCFFNYFICYIYLVLKFTQMFFKEIICSQMQHFDLELWAHQFLIFLAATIFMLKIFKLKKIKKSPSNEFLYTKQILYKQKSSPIFSNCYQYNKFYRFSKQFIITNSITIFLINHASYKLYKNSQAFIATCVKYANIGLLFLSGEKNLKPDLNLIILIENLSKIFHQIIITSIIIAYLMSLGQIFLEIRAYKSRVLRAYRGTHEKVLGPNQLANSKIISASIHFSGYKIAYCLWGYTNLLFFTILCVTLIRFLVSFKAFLILIVKLILPCTIFYFLKKLLIRSLASLILTDQKENLNLRNEKIYFLTNYIGFFFNCFFTWFICLVRLFLSFFGFLIFAFRLDNSVCSRKLEKIDPGFISYASFVHMEVYMSHPIKLAFCQIVSIYSKQRKVLKFRNKWFLLYTLIKNPQLKNYRKKCSIKNSNVKSNFLVFTQKADYELNSEFLI